MAKSTFSGPVVSQNGFVSAAIATSALPGFASVPAGTVYVINDNGAGNDEYCVVISTGAAWVTAVGAALS
tara:strand:- start:289 stop:498 length:210 start_codon:yes stop_codon:yes gene_type:complete